MARFNKKCILFSSESYECSFLQHWVYALKKKRDCWLLAHLELK